MINDGQVGQACSLSPGVRTGLGCLSVLPRTLFCSRQWAPMEAPPRHIRGLCPGLKDWICGTPATALALLGGDAM